MTSEAAIKQLLEAYDFKVEKIPEQDHETPDFLVQGKRESYLVECKERQDDKAELQAKESLLRSGGVYSEAITTSRKRSVYKGIRKAASQLQHGPSHVDFRLAWYHVTGARAELKAQQIVSSLYGSMDLIDWDNGDNRLRPCYYFEFSEFFRLRGQLDGAVASFGDKGVLCLNNHSKKYDKLKSSELRRIFSAGIRDPIEEEKLGDAYIADTDIDRRDKKAILAYLQKKYGTKLIDINMNHFSASALVPDDPGRK